ALLARQFLADWPIPRSVRVESAQRELVWPSGEEVTLRFHVTGEGLTSDLQGEVRIEPTGRPSEPYPLIPEAITSPQEATFVARIPAEDVDFAYRAWLKDGR